MSDSSAVHAAATDAVKAGQEDVVVALQQRLLEEAQNARSGDLKEFAVALGVSMDKLLVMRGQF